MMKAILASVRFNELLDFALSGNLPTFPKEHADYNEQFCTRE
jgi:hypothetical protein